MLTLARRGASRAFPESFLDAVYRMPRPMLWFEEWQRERNLDLDTFDDPALDRERRCVQRRLDYEPVEVRRRWLEHRLTAIDRERGTRRHPIAQIRTPAPANPSSRARPPLIIGDRRS